MLMAGLQDMWGQRGGPGGHAAGSGQEEHCWIQAN